MKNETNKLLLRAKDCFDDALFNLNYHRYMVVVNRAYYCIFDCVQALLIEQSIYTKTHQGAHTKFSELFIKTNIFEVSMNEQMKVVFDMRQMGDYDLDSTITEEDAKLATEYAQTFYQSVKKYFAKQENLI